MSLLEDVFLEDEAGEAQELERIIEDDEYEERAREEPDSNEDSEKEDEAEEDKRRVDPASTKTKRVVKNPRVILNPARLTGPRGISVIPEHFKDFKFKGKGHEKEDLDLVLKKLEHWAYRLYPKFKFEDCLKKMETLGKKRPVMVHLHKIRSDQLVTEETVVQKDSSDEELAAPLPEDDEFDQLLQQQIDLARATPGPGERRPGLSTPAVDKKSPLMMPKATSSPSISDEQKERMIRNRKLAEERRLARLKAATLIENGNTVSTVDLTNGNNKNTSAVTDNTNSDISDETRTKKNRSNVIDSSDDENVSINHAYNVQKTMNKNVIDLTDLHQERNQVTSNELVCLDVGMTDKEIDNIQNKRKNVIDSSDNEDVSINQTTTTKTINKNVIDLTDLHQERNQVASNEVVCLDTEMTDKDINNIQNKRNNVKDNSDEEDVSINQTTTTKTINKNVIDLTELHQRRNHVTHNEVICLDMEMTDKKINGIQKKRSDILDSSDDDDDTGMMTMNQSVVVDVHKSNSNDDEIVTNDQDCGEIKQVADTKEQNDDSSKDNQNSNNIDDSNVNVGDITNKNIPSDCPDIMDNLTEKEVQNDKDIDIITTNTSENNNKDLEHETEKNINDVDRNSTNEIENSKTDKEINIENDLFNDGLDDLMDVDFDEDF